MDLRQKKTRAAIFNAFTELIEKKSYSTISIQDIIDKAMVGRSTFYAHFETKDALVDALCEELFEHIMATELHAETNQGLYFCCNPSHSVTCHILHHLLENDHNILTLLSCDSSHKFRRHFKSEMIKLVGNQLKTTQAAVSVPEDVLVNHIAGTFVEMVMYWLKNKREESPEELDAYFHALIDPLVQLN